MSGSDRPAPWQSPGLRFECTRCGTCCSGATGLVWVCPDECRRIAAYLRLSVEQFVQGHLRRGRRRLSLREQNNGDCEFLVREPNGLTTCSIHPVRPVQCRSWPFWPSNLASPETWAAAARECPGIGQGPFHPLPVIQAALAKNGDLPL